MKPKYKRTLVASYTGYVVQAVVNNLAPLLFVVFQTNYAVSLAQLTGLITLNFGVQLVVDGASTLFVDRLGYKTTAVLAHILCSLGLLSMGLLPALLPNVYLGLVLAIIILAAGGGLIEVIISPIVEALPTEHKSASMSLLHSFYCWGFVAVVVLSTLFFNLAGLGNWMWLCCLWALVPLCNCILFARAPVKHLIAKGETALPLRKLFGKKMFLLLFVAMFCAGASEQAMSQWASLFAESGLGVSKTVGDLLGPCVFAVLMGIARLILGSGRVKLSLESILVGSSVLCAASYLLAALAPTALLSLLGCGLCGFAVGALWPGFFSLAAKRIKHGGTSMYALFALAGDIGCAAGPGLVGFISNASEDGTLQVLGSSGGRALQSGLLLATLFPILLVLCLILVRKGKKQS